MKKTTLFLVLACGLGNVQAQTAPPKIDWNLNKVLWSQTHHDPLKPGKPVMTFDTVTNWLCLGAHVTISPNGHYIAYDIHKGGPVHEGWGRTPAKLIIQSTDNKWKQALIPTKFNTRGFFSSDSKQFVYEDGENLCIIKLGTNERSYVKDFASYKVPFSPPDGPYNGSANWIAVASKDKDLTLHNLSSGEKKEFSNVSSYGLSDRLLTCQTEGETPELIIYDLKNGQEHRFPAPKSYALSLDLGTLLFNQGNSLDSISLANGTKTNIWTAGSDAESVISSSFDSTNKKVLFTIKEANSNSVWLWKEGKAANIWSAKNDTDSVTSTSFDPTNKKILLNIKQAKGNSIWIWKEGMPTAKMLANQSTVHAKAGFLLQNGLFSQDGQYITFSLQKPEAKYTVPKGAVELTLWSSRDKLLQTTQAKQKDTATTRNGYMSISDGKILYMSKENESGYARGDILIIRKEIIDRDKTTDRFWDANYDQHSYSIKNLKTGKTYFVGSYNTPYGITLASSPDWKYAIYFDSNKGSYRSINLSNGKSVDLCKGLNTGHFKARDYEQPGWKQRNGPCPTIGWLESGNGYLVYDDYDIWRLDPTGKAPVNLTNGYGRKHQITFQIMDLERDQGQNIIKENKFLLTAFNIRTKENGFYSMNLASKKDPQKLTMGPQFLHVKSYATHFDDAGMEPLKASNANTWIVKRQTPETGANYCLTHDFKTYKPLTSIRPDKKVNWYTRTLHYYKSLDGTEGEGILYKPENFNPKKKYPVIIPYYGRYACYRYVYQDPVLAWCPVAFCTSPGWLASHGYLVFVPSIRTAPIKYGAACFNAIEGAAKYLNTLPYVDKGKIGAMCHSWSAKLGAYQFTHSKLIRAMWINEGYMFGDMINTAFAPTTRENDSALGSVENWGYGELWKNKKDWLDQTTVLNLDRSQMPLMLSCNSHDLKTETYASQAFEIYNGLRRLDKPVWWLRYSKNCDHTFEGNELYDVTIRFTQFFDHFLKGAPAPKWMTRGIPNKLVGVETRLELDPKGYCGDPKCKTCKKSHHAK